MRLLLTGGSGLVGTALRSALGADGHSVAVLRRTAELPRGEYATWDPIQGQIQLAPAGVIEAVIHLAGETVAQRWTPEARRRIRQSRVAGTQVLCSALAQLQPRPHSLICASAIGYYGSRGDAVLDELSSPGTGFLADITQEWESAAMAARTYGIRVVVVRLGLVLARQGGALAKMLPAFQAGLAGRIGDGSQWWSWILLEDVVSIFREILGQPSWTGPINAVAPNPVTNREFTQQLARALHRPALIPMPAFLVKAVFGPMGEEALLGSARVQPRRLLDAGFAFAYPTLASGLKQALKR